MHNKSHSTWPRRTRWISGLVVAALIAAGFALFRVEVASLQSVGYRPFPYNDDWGTPLRFLAEPGDSLGQFWSNVFRQHNESRKVTLKLLTLFSDRVVNFHSGFTNDLSYLLRAGIVILASLPLLLRPASGSLALALRGVVVAYGLVIYAVGPANLHNGLWPVQNSFFMGQLFALACLSVLCLPLFPVTGVLRRPRRKLWVPMLLAGGLGGLSIFSFSGNVALLPVAGLITLAAGGQGPKPRRWRLRLRRSEVLIALGLLTAWVLLYFWNWTFPARHEELRGNDISLRYLALFLAGFYQFLKPPGLFALTQLVGLLVAGLTGLVLTSQALGLSRLRLSWNWAAPMAQVMFLVVLASLSSIARGGTALGSRYALEARYNSISILLSLLVATMLALWLDGQLVRLQRPIPFSRLLRLPPLLLLVGSLGLGLTANESWRASIQDHFSPRSRQARCMKRYLHARERGRPPKALSRAVTCSKPLFQPGPEVLYQRLKLWCSKPARNASYTVKGLCTEMLNAPRRKETGGVTMIQPRQLIPAAWIAKHVKNKKN